MTTQKHTPTRQDRYEERVGLIVTVADELDMILDEKNITKSAFAKLIGKSKSLVSRLLNGDHNMTLGTLADACTMLNIEPRITFTDKETGVRLNPDYEGQPIYNTNAISEAPAEPAKTVTQEELSLSISQGTYNEINFRKLKTEIKKHNLSAKEELPIISLFPQNEEEYEDAIAC